MNAVRPLALFLFAFGLSASAHADIVKCVHQGRVSYQETPCKPGQTKALDLRPSSQGIEKPSQTVTLTPEAAPSSGPTVSIIPVSQGEIPLRSTSGEVRGLSVR